MRAIGFDGLYSQSVTVNSIFTMRQRWSALSEFSMLSHKRPTNALLYFYKGDATFHDTNGAICRAEKGELIYIPKGKNYTISFSENGETVTYLLEFNVVRENGEEVLLTEEISSLPYIPSHISESFKELLEAYTAPICSPCAVLSKVYGIFYDISSSIQKHGLMESEFGSIFTGITAIEDFSAKTPSIAELARQSGMSVGTFNALFKRYCGMTPALYRSHLRLQRAKELLSRSDVRISEAACALGFDDVPYFCRFFKRSTGLTPTEWRERQNERSDLSEEP